MAKQKTTKEKVGISYLRFSSKGQADGDSIERQERKCDEFCQAHGITLLDEDKYRDEGMSGYDGSNIAKGHLGKILAKAEAGDFPDDCYLVVEKVDRLSRADIQTAMKMFFSLLDCKMNICSVIGNQIILHKDDLDYDSRDGMSAMLQVVIGFVLANDESKTKSDRILSARAKARSKAAESGKLMTNMVPFWLSVVDGEVVENVERCDVVRRIFDMALGGMGSYAICSRLNKEGVDPFGVDPTAKGKVRNKSGLWSKTAVERLLTDRRVLGEVQFMKKNEEGVRKKVGDPVEDYFRKVVDEDVFYQVEAGRKSRKIEMGRLTKNGEKNIFKGLGKCFCGGNLHYRNRNKTGETDYVYLECGLRCGMKGTQYRKLKRVFAKLCSVTAEEIKVLKRREKSEKLKESKLSVIGGRIDQRRLVYDRLNMSLGSDDLEAGEVKIIVRKMSEIESDIEGMKDEVVKLEGSEAIDNEENDLEDFDLDEVLKKDVGFNPLTDEEMIMIMKLRYSEVRVRSSKLGKLGQKIEFAEVLKDGSEIFNVVEFDPKSDVDFLVGWSSDGSLTFDDWVKEPKIDRDLLLGDSRTEIE